MADAKPTLEPTEWQRKIADRVQELAERKAREVFGSHFIESYVRSIKGAIWEAIVWQREEDAKIAEGFGYTHGQQVAIHIRRNGGK